MPPPSSGLKNKSSKNQRKAGNKQTGGFEVLTAVVMRSSVFWDITPCSPLKATDVSEEHVASIFRVED
jgi:hypothetical protein